jgi:hypothetical protein
VAIVLCMQVSETLLVRDDFISPSTAREALDVIDNFRRRFPLPIISRASGERPLRYSVIDGLQIALHLPEIQRLHAKTTRLVRKLFGDAIETLADEQVACNVNITQPGGSYRYHYDRNAITALLYLNETSGGETECYPGHRLRVPASLQRDVDRVLGSRVVRSVFGRQVLVRPRTGRLLIMRGDRCLHSVREVSGPLDRINIVMSYDVKGAEYANGEQLNSYLYQRDYLEPNDPNYA